MNDGRTALPILDFNTDAILLKADASPYVLTYQSSLSGVAFAISKDGGILILDKHGFFGKQVDDMRALHQELGFIIEEADRWKRT
ncbi:MAG: hypothetical protein IJH41_03885 [Eubacterium sp.]|nr:hypothetical protein [Eubacterium sp.]